MSYFGFTWGFQLQITMAVPAEYYQYNDPIKFLVFKA